MVIKNITVDYQNFENTLRASIHVMQMHSENPQFAGIVTEQCRVNGMTMQNNINAKLH